MREEVSWFAEKMEETLQKHDERKGVDGWKGDDPRDLSIRILEEAAELINQILLNPNDPIVIRHSADVANMCMMLADVTREHNE